MNSRPLAPVLAVACASLFAVSATAQVMPNEVAIGDTGSFSTGGGLTLFDLVTKKTRTISGHKGGTHRIVALDGLKPSDLYGNSSRPTAGRQPPLDHYTLKAAAATNGANAAIVDLGLFGALRDVHVFEGERFYTHSSTRAGLMKKPGTAGSTLVVALPSPNKIAVLGRKIYVSTLPATGASAIYEVDMAAAKPTAKALKLVASPGKTLPKTIVAMCAVGHEATASVLYVIDDTKQIFRVTPSITTGVNTQAFLSPGQAPAVACAWHPKAKVGLVVATAGNLYSAVEYGNGKTNPTALYTSPTNNTIFDIATDLGGARRFGDGCADNNSNTPSISFEGAPYMGATNFAMTTQSSQKSAIARLAVGLSNTSYAGSKLPITLGGKCQLLVSIDFLLNTTTDTTGFAKAGVGTLPSVPALLGQRVYAQWAVAAPTALGFAVSQGMEIVLR